MDKLNQERKNFIWNTIAGLVNAAEAVIFLMVVNRTNGSSDAGIVTMAFALGNLLMTIGKFGMRNFEVTDIQNEYCFNDYFTTCFITTILMVVSLFAYILLKFFNGSYGLYKSIIIILISLIYVVESLEDIFCGLYQKNGRLDIAGKAFTLRWGIILVVSTALLFFTNNLILSLGITLLLSIIFSIYYNGKKYKHFYSSKLFKIKNVFSILKACFPLFFANFLSNYVTNAPKYAIDACLTEKILACYGYIAMPVFVISLLNSFFYQPKMVRLSLFWKEKNLKAFKKDIYIQFIIIIILTICCLIGAYFLGVPFLSILYACDLTSYKKPLLLLLFGGGVLAFDGYISVILTIMRIQKKMMYGYLSIAVFEFIFANYFVVNWNVMGAVVMYIIAVCFLSIYFSFICFKYINTKEKIVRSEKK